MTEAKIDTKGNGKSAAVSLDEMQELENLYTTGVYSKRALRIEKGEGAYLWDSEGKRYIDCVGGQGAANLGHANPAVVKAVSEQAAKLITCPEMFYNSTRAALMEKLSEISGLKRVFLSNSGTEAVEAGIKFSRLLTGRTGIVAAKRGFHGRTMGALSATWENKYRKHFVPLVPGYKHIAYNDLDALEETVDAGTAAVLLEVVQGEGGVRPGDVEFIYGAQEICHQNGALLVVDEVQTGFGRTGKMFAFQHYGLEPDILCLAKSIAGGIPMGATLISDRLGKLPPAVHGSTFGGNPLACAASLAAIGYLEDNQLPQKAAELGAWFKAELQALNLLVIREVRGLGLMVGVELRKKVTPYLKDLMAEGVLALPAGLTVMRFLPPLVIKKEDLKTVLEKVEKVLSA